MRRRTLLVSLTLLTTLACAACGSGSKPPAQSTLRGTVLSPPTDAPGFTLRDQANRAVSLRGERGHYVVVTFLYTHCPDVCPVIAGNLNLALASGAGRRARLRVLAVSVDPARDTLTAVRRYVVRHRLLPTFHYLIGARTSLARVWREYHVAASAGPRATVSHTAFELLIDPRGRERLAYDSTVRAAWLEHDLDVLARQSSS